MKTLLFVLALLTLSGCATNCSMCHQQIDVQTPYGADCYRDCLHIRGLEAFNECVRYCPGVVVSEVCR